MIFYVAWSKEKNLTINGYVYEYLSVYLRLLIQIFPYTKDTESKEFQVLMIYV